MEKGWDIAVGHGHHWQGQTVPMIDTAAWPGPHPQPMI
jgi:hypothetical protein